MIPLFNLLLPLWFLQEQGFKKQQYNLMLAFAKYELHHVNKLPSVFPPLIGSHRKLKTDNSPKQSPHKNLTPPHRQQQMTFLNRMKKARELIFSHQRSKKMMIEKNQKLIDRSKTDNTQRIYRNLQQKGFSQVVYHIGSSPKKVAKKDSFDNQRFNDKILRQCKSSFMPNQKQRHRLTRNYFKIPKRHQKTQRTELKNHPRSMFFHQNSENEPHQLPKKLKIESSEKYVMQHLFPSDVMSSNGEQLVEKLKKCREEKENPEIALKNQDKQNEQNDEQEIERKNSNNSIQFPYSQGKKKAKSKFLCRMQEKNNKKFKISWESTRQIKKQENPESVEQTKVDANENDQGETKDQEIKRQRQKLKNQSKSAYFDENFKISAWNEEQPAEFQNF